MALRKRSVRSIEAAAVLKKYEELQKRTKSMCGEEAGTHVLCEIVRLSCRYLETNSEVVELTSRVPGKRYFAFRHKTAPHRLSRAINSDLFITGYSILDRLLRKLETNPSLTWLNAEECNRLLYTVAITFCAFNDATSTGDKKTLGTYFETLVGHLISVALGVKPRKRVEVMTVEDERSTLTTDYIFDLGPKKLKFHVPVKISTRERVIQVWAHQRVLNGVYGEGRFRGILVALAETKVDLTSHEVSEICLPDQWAVYQRFVSRLDRVYYLDLPPKYAALAHEFPFIAVKSFGEFFKEVEKLTTPMSW